MTAEGVHPPAPLPRSPQKIAADVGMALMRSADTYRSHGGSHPLSTAGLQRVFERLTEATVTDPLQLEVTLGGLLWGERPVTTPTQGRKQDTLALPLFSEGVRRITFLPGLPFSELEPLLRAWFDAASGQASSEGVTTYFWESEPKSVLLVIIDVFALGEDAGVDDPAAQSRARTQTARERIDAMVSAIAARGFAAAADSGSGEAVALSAGTRVGSDDIALLRAEGLRDITADALARQDVTARPPDALSSTELQGLTDELARLREQKGQSFASAVLHAAALSEEPDRSQLAGRLEQLGRVRLDESRFKEALGEYQRLVELAKQDAPRSAAHTAVLLKLRNQLVSDATFDKLLAAIDTEQGNEGAVEFLKTVRKPFEQKMVAALPKLKTEQGKKAIARLISDLLEGAAAIAAQVRTMSATMFTEVAARVTAMSPDEAIPILTEALHSTDPAVRRAATAALTPALALRLGKNVLQARLGDTDAGVRAAARKLAVDTEDPSAVGPLLALMKRGSTAADEKRSIYETLSKIPGPASLNGLVDELEHQHDSDLKAACIAALGVLGDPRAKAPLEALQHKLLTAPSLKAACREALARIAREAPAR